MADETNEYTDEEAADYVLNPYSEEELSAARKAIVDALREGPNPMSYEQLSGNTQVDRDLLVVAVGNLRIEELVTLEQHGHEILVWLVE